MYLKNISPVSPSDVLLYKYMFFSAKNSRRNTAAASGQGREFDTFRRYSGFLRMEWRYICDHTSAICSAEVDLTYTIT